MSHRKRNAQDDDDVWGTSVVQERPRRSLDPIRKERRKARFYKGLIWVLLSLSAITAVGSLSVLGRDATSGDQAQSSQQILNPPGKAEAVDAVSRWLGTDPAPLPGAHVVSWNGARQIETASSAAGNGLLASENESAQRWVHSFTAQVDATFDDNGNKLTPTRTYTIEQLVGYLPSQGASAVGNPALTPNAPTDATMQVDEAAWPNGVSTSPTQPVQNAITAWVSAYTSGDPATLSTAVSDPDTSHAYIPLTGVVQAKWTSIGAAYLLSGKEVKDNASTSDTEVVQVSLQIDRQGVTEQDNVTLPEMHLDLLLTGAQSGSPKVVAWGAPGTGHLLTPFQNATTAGRADAQ